jgi:hypothetical protein
MRGGCCPRASLRPGAATGSLMERNPLAEALRSFGVTGPSVARSSTADSLEVARRRNARHHLVPLGPKASELKRLRLGVAVRTSAMSETLREPRGRRTMPEASNTCWADSLQWNWS